MSLVDQINAILDSPAPNDSIQTSLDESPIPIKYKKMLAGIICAIGLAVLGLFVFHTFAKKPRIPQVFLVNTANESAQVRPMAYPNQSVDTIQRWAAEVVTAVYTFDFANLDSQLAQAEEYFTKDGWESMVKVLKNGPLLKDVEGKQVSVTVTPLSRPIIESTGGTPGNEFAWKVVVPILLSMSGDFQTKNTKLLVRLVIVRVPTTENPKGLGVSQFLTGSL